MTAIESLQRCSKTTTDGTHGNHSISSPDTWWGISIRKCFTKAFVRPLEAFDSLARVSILEVGLVESHDSCWEATDLGPCVSIVVNKIQVNIIMRRSHAKAPLHFRCLHRWSLETRLLLMYPAQYYCDLQDRYWSLHHSTNTPVQPQLTTLPQKFC